MERSRTGMAITRTGQVWPRQPKRLIEAFDALCRPLSIAMIDKMPPAEIGAMMRKFTRKELRGEPWRFSIMGLNPVHFIMCQHATVGVEWLTQAITEMIEAGVPVDTKDSDPPLEFAVLQGAKMKPIVELLIKSGADVEHGGPSYKVGNTVGNIVTPLYLACQDEDPTMMLILLDAGADITRKPANGRSALQLMKPALRRAYRAWVAKKQILERVQGRRAQALPETKPSPRTRARA
jgi:hypothetical protein